MHRRTYLRAAILATIPLSGCATSDTTTDNPRTDDESVTSATPSRTSTILVDETLYSKTRYPVELTAGDTLHFDVELEKGTICIVDIASVDAGENVFKKRIRTTAEFTYTVEHDGPHYITVQGMDQVNIEIRKS